MTVLTIQQIDRELASRTREVADISTALVELDGHPGIEHVRRYPPTGVTAQRWAVIEKSIGLLWEGLGWMTSILESAQALRAHRSNPDHTDRAELTRLLRGRSLALPQERIPLVQWVSAGHDESVGQVGLADTAERIRATYPEVAEFLRAVDEINSVVAAGIAPSLKRLDEAGAPVPEEIADLLAVSATDPLSLTVPEVEERIAAIARCVDRRSAELAELVALQANWPEELASTAARLDALRDGFERAAQIRARAEQSVVTGSLPVHTDAEPALRAELGSMTTPDPAALRQLRHRIERELRLIHEGEQLAQGLLDRRSELRGRLTAYQAKATRLGLAEDADLRSSSQIAFGLLSRQPCDLRAVTRAITDYQQLLLAKRGTPR